LSECQDRDPINTATAIPLIAGTSDGATLNLFILNLIIGHLVILNLIILNLFIGNFIDGSTEVATHQRCFFKIRTSNDGIPKCAGHESRPFKLSIREISIIEIATHRTN